MLQNNYINEWENSYRRGENHIFYPQAEVVKFLNRYICKKKDEDRYEKIISSEEKILALDFACGIGTHSFLLNDFNIETVGVDISETAIVIANDRKLKLSKGKRDIIDFYSIKGPSELEVFSSNYFNFTIAEACLDSMPFKIAQLYIEEIIRISKNYIYLSLVSSHDQSARDELVKEDHEYGTIQSFYDEDRINLLLHSVRNNLKYKRKVTEFDCIRKKIFNERYHLVIDMNSS